MKFGRVRIRFGACALIVVLLGLVPLVATQAADPAGRPVTVVAIVDSGFSPYHYDFLGHQHPWNTDADPANDFDFQTDPATYIEGFPGATPIPVTIPTTADQDVNALYDGKTGTDAAAWEAFERSTLDDVDLHWFPGTKVIGAVNFGESFFGDNLAHGTRSAASAAGNLHGMCTECLFVLVRNGQNGAGLRWAAAQPWIDVVSNSYGASVLGNSVRDNVYFHGPVAETKAAAEAGQTIVFSAGNGLLNAFDVPMFTYWSSEKGPDWMVTVGATTANHHQTYLGAGKPVDISAPGALYRSTGGTTATGIGQHSGTSNAAPVVAGSFGHTIQRAREVLGDTTETHSGGVVADGPPVPCGAANANCPLQDGVLTRSELRDLVFHNVLPSAPHLMVNTVVPTTPAAYYYQGHGVIRGTSEPGARDGERQRFSDALIGAVSPHARPAGEEDWFVVDSKCRQRLWGAWTGGYFQGQDPALDPVADPIAVAFDTWCSAVPEETFASMAALPIPSGVSPASTDAERTSSQDYIGVIGDLTILSCEPTVGDRTVGGACFDVAPGDRSVTVEVDDARGPEVGAQLMFRDAEGEAMLPEYWTFCTSSGPVPVPTGAVELRVYVDTLFAIFDCEDASKIATLGTINATFS